MTPELLLSIEMFYTGRNFLFENLPQKYIELIRAAPRLKDMRVRPIWAGRKSKSVPIFSTATDEEVAMTEHIASGKMREPEIVKWLKRYTEKD